MSSRTSKLLLVTQVTIDGICDAARRPERLAKAALGGSTATARSGALGVEQDEADNADTYARQTRRNSVGPPVSGEQDHDGGDGPQHDSRGDDRRRIGETRTQCTHFGRIRFRLALHEM